MGWEKGIVWRRARVRVRGWGVGESLGWERDRSERVEEGWG